MATKNSINNRSQELTLDPGASGDAYLQFDIAGTGEFRIGVDDDDGDAFKISQGSALGTNDTFTMSASGERLMPLQPAFSAYPDSTLTNVTGDGTNYTVIYDTEVFDQGSDFNTGTGEFTAPITGRYHMSMSMVCEDVSASHTRGNIIINTSNSFYYIMDVSYAAVRTSSNVVRIAGSVVVDMDSGDFARVQLLVSGGALAIDVNGSAGRNTTMFGGFLVC